mmetsp:Transcript_13658/g.25766  ORF Transcript_13658/g.25766 Transcript_13658/m.25766 type:complete len:399 (-) Transcript_13658:2598-3794(-)
MESHRLITDEESFVSSYIDSNGLQVYVKSIDDRNRIIEEVKHHRAAYSLCPESILRPLDFNLERGFVYEYHNTVLDGYIHSTTDRLTEEELLSNMVECFKVGRTLHENEICHRKFDMSTLFITESRRILIGDFSQATTHAGPLRQGESLPLNHHNSPETHFRLASDWYKQDVWNLGICLFFISIREIEGIDYEDKHFVSTTMRKSDVPESVARIIEEACRYDQRRRLSMQQLHEMSVKALNICKVHILRSFSRAETMYSTIYDSPINRRKAEVCFDCGENFDDKHDTGRVSLECGHNICERCAVDKNRMSSYTDKFGDLTFNLSCGCGHYTQSNCLEGFVGAINALWTLALEQQFRLCPSCGAVFEQYSEPSGYFICQCKAKICLKCFQVLGRRHRCA